MTSGDASGKTKDCGSLSRRQSRRKAFELLFELEYRADLTGEAILNRTFNDPDVSECFCIDEDEEGYVAGVLDANAKKFIGELVHAVCNHRAEIDSELEQHPLDWSYDRIGTTERLLLQLALAEMVYIGTSYKVVINEILDMAKAYAQEEARRFINGILGATVKNLDELKARVKAVEGCE